VGGVEESQLEELASVIPVVEGVLDVEAFIALKPDQIGIECRSRRSGQRRLADAGFPFEKQGPPEAKG
jgi:hypothetical protein